MPIKKEISIKKKKTRQSNPRSTSNWSNKVMNGLRHYEKAFLSNRLKDSPMNSQKPRSSNNERNTSFKLVNKHKTRKKYNLGRVNRILVPSLSPHKMKIKKRSPIKIFHKPSLKQSNKKAERILVPINNAVSKSGKNAKNILLYENHFRPTGLSPKEKNYIICTCQAHTSRYTKLKRLATEAMVNNKIFTIYGSCNTVRSALVERGWVEKVLPQKMNLAKIKKFSYTNKSELLKELEILLLSYLVEKSTPNFIWQTKDDQHDFSANLNSNIPTIINKLKTDAIWTTKGGLCSSLKRNYWFYIDNVAEVNGPRTYNGTDASETEELVRDYQITACTSLLKWVLSMVANKRPVFVDTGKISMDVVIFALNRCKEYLFRKQNKDIDKTLSSATPGQWNAFLRKYYKIIGKEEFFSTDKDNKLPLYLGFAKFLLKEIHKYRPQLSCEGCHNIWIIKPAHCSRGRGIRMACKLALITNWLVKSNTKYVIQKYIEEPLLIHDTKFDIRQYYLVTSTFPLVIWMYKDCYLKFSSQKYNLRNYHESIHLTNNAVQRKYKNCTDRHSELPVNNMWDLNTYKEYLNKHERNKVWDDVIYPGMKKSIISVMLNCQDNLSVSKNRFELYGCDFILDRDYKPWLIEINSSPDLNPTTPVTAKMCPAVVADIIKVVVDFANNPKLSTGNFECIYHQPMTMPRCCAVTDMIVRGTALPLGYFYKGNIEIEESYDNADIVKERDIRSILSKLKSRYEENYNKVDRENYSVLKKEREAINESNKEQGAQNESKSDREFRETASIINSQLDKLMDRISTDSVHSLIQTSSKSDKIETPEVKIHSDVDCILPITEDSQVIITQLERRPRNIFKSIQPCNSPFKFSPLDDGPHGKASFFECVLAKNSSKQSSIKSSTLKNIERRVRGPCSSCGVLKATTKIISFINKKEKEYSKMR